MLNVAVKRKVIVDPHFKFTLGVHSTIEFANRNRRKSEEKLLVCANTLFKDINGLGKGKVDHISQGFLDLLGVYINLNKSNLRSNTGNFSVQ